MSAIITKNTTPFNVSTDLFPFFFPFSTPLLKWFDRALDLKTFFRYSAVWTAACFFSLSRRPALLVDLSWTRSLLDEALRYSTKLA